ncbi:ATP-binding protein [Rossellomorea sp. SC111]|uniref:ATP-binding protein n=1 Tax=Rossellomorea sp. SC111 TaxID=2968985 RepID=UPI00215B3A84|nr:ATP-binding protein [Rossellomorea sp. SC111]MCR8847977.1 ATP-binding protein [Rossellomorea sp. SC111]
MEFVLLVAISFIPVIISGSLLFYSKTTLTKALSLFLLLLCLWQIDIAFLYANDYFSPELIDHAFRIFRIGPIMIMPLMSYFAYYLVQSHDELRKYRLLFSKGILLFLIGFSLIVYGINFTSIGVTSYTIVPETAFAPSHLMPVYGMLNSTFIINVLLVFVHTFCLLGLTLKLNDAFFRLFYAKLVFGSFFVFLNGVISGFGVLPLYYSSFNSILVAILLFLGFFQMQSEQLNVANDSLLKQSNLLEEIMNINPNYLVVLDKDNRIVKINHSICALLMISGEQMMGMKFSTFIKTHQLKTTRGELQKLTRINGDVHYIQWGSTTLRYQDKELYTLFYGIDFTNQKQNEQLLLTSEKSKVIGELAASIAHEIRNPLTTVRGFIQLMKEKNAESPFEGIMLEEIDRVNEVLKELLLLAKPEANDTADLREEDMQLNVHQEVNHVRILFEAVATEQNKRIYMSSSLPSDTQVAFHESHFKQVLLNTIKNSLEAVKEKGSIKLKLDESNGCVRVRIIDNGKGISKKRLDRIGEPYFTNKDKGTGIGLTICFKLMNDYNGHMTVKSKLGWGTTVTMLLPKKN